MYCTTDDVYNATKLSTTEVPLVSIESFIKGAEREIDLITYTTYWKLEVTGTAESSGSSTTITDDEKNWGVNEYQDCIIYITGGTGLGQIRLIESNTSDTITISRAWAVDPDNTSVYKLYYTATPAYYGGETDEEPLDGNGVKYMFLPLYPIRLIEDLTVDTTSVTVSNLYQQSKTGRIELKNTAEVSRFTRTSPQLIDINYWWGVSPMPYEICRATVVLASMKTLEAQMGGTHNVPSTYSLPEGSVTIGQAYINIKTTWDVLQKEWSDLKVRLIKYPHFA